MSFKKYLWGIIAFLLLTSCDSSQKQPKLCSMKYIEESVWEEKISFWGMVDAKRSTPVVAQTEGVIDLLVAPGLSVKKDTVIFKLRNLEHEQAYELSKNAANIAKQQYERAVVLAKNKTISKATLEEKENAYIQEKQRLAKATLDFESTQFKAPFDGIVGTFKVQDGSFVKRSDTITLFYDPSELIVRFSIPIRYRNALIENPNIFIENKVYAIDYIPSLVNPDTQSLDFSILTPNIHHLSGEVVEVEIISSFNKKAITIPMAAVRFSNDTPWVLLLENGVLKRQDIELSNDNTKNGIVLNGLKAGDSICLDPKNFHEGERVTPYYEGL